MKKDSDKIKKLLPTLKENVKLAPFTSFKIGGEARFFYEARRKKDLVRAVKAARELKIPYFILGGGTNLLISDNGFDGLVIKVENQELKIQGKKTSVGAGTLLSRLLEETAKAGLSNLEFCAGIPGTMGGAIFGNAGVEGQGIGDFVLEVEVLDKNGRTKKFPQRQCGFSYRQSRFQTSGEVILQAILGLERGEKRKISQKIASFLEKRKSQPRAPSAGSIFKNPEGDWAGRLIEACGLKGKKIVEAQISPTHANWIVNLGNASCWDVLKLILLAKRAVREKFGILLEEEVVPLGFDFKDGEIYY